MDTGCRNENENIYFRCRKEAAAHNDALASREGAAEMLGISVSSLSKYELGVTKVVPVDIVVMMADLYNAPELRLMYCKNECPIGKSLNVDTEIRSLESVTVRLLKQLQTEEVDGIKRTLLSIAEDGKVGEDESEKLFGIVEQLASLQKSISALILWSEKFCGGSGNE